MPSHFRKGAFPVALPGHSTILFRPRDASPAYFRFGLPVSGCYPFPVPGPASGPACPVTGSDGPDDGSCAVPAVVARPHGDVIGRGRAEPLQRQGGAGHEERGGGGRGAGTFRAGKGAETGSGGWADRKWARTVPETNLASPELP